MSPCRSILMRFSYTPEAWARLIKKPEDRREVARAIVEKIGGKLHGFWYGFGDYDGYVLIEAPNNVSAAALSVWNLRRWLASLGRDHRLAHCGRDNRSAKEGTGVALQTSWS